jgi:hypothetical protein
MREFIEARGIQGATVTGAALYRVCVEWVEAQGLPPQVRRSRRACLPALVRQGFRRAKASGGVPVRCGLRVRSGAEDTPLSHSLRHV